MNDNTGAPTVTHVKLPLRFKWPSGCQVNTKIELFICQVLRSKIPHSHKVSTPTCQVIQPQTSLTCIAHPQPHLVTVFTNAIRSKGKALALLLPIKLNSWEENRWCLASHSVSILRQCLILGGGVRGIYLLTTNQASSQQST